VRALIESLCTQLPRHSDSIIVVPYRPGDVRRRAVLAVAGRQVGSQPSRPRGSGRKVRN
jgi:hypothetical protein